jgi:hypothetical protein
MPALRVCISERGGRGSNQQDQALADRLVAEGRSRVRLANSRPVLFTNLSQRLGSWTREGDRGVPVA